MKNSSKRLTFAMALVVVAGLFAGFVIFRNSSASSSRFDDELVLGGAPPPADYEWVHRAIEADRAHNTPMGAGVLIAIVDDGAVDGDHRSVGNHVRPGVDLGDGQPDGGTVLGRHPTAMAAIAAGNSTDILPGGVAQLATILPVDISGVTESGSEPTIAEGIRAAVREDANVISIPLTCCDIGNLEDLEAAVAEARQAGAIVVGSAGGGEVCEPDQATVPVDIEGVIFVGASDRSGEITACSGDSRIDVLAPGFAVVPVGEPGQFMWLSGTGPANSYVVGIVAVALSAGNGPQDVEQAVVAAGSDQVVSLGDVLDRLPDEDDQPTAEPSPETTPAPPAAFHVMIDGPSTNTFSYGRIRWDGTLLPQEEGGWSGVVAAFFPPEFQSECVMGCREWVHTHWTLADVSISADHVLTMMPRNDMHYYVPPAASGDAGDWWNPTGQLGSDLPSRTDKVLPEMQATIRAMGEVVAALEWPDDPERALHVTFEDIPVGDGYFIRLRGRDSNPIDEIPCDAVTGPAPEGCPSLSVDEAIEFITGHEVPGQVNR